MPNQVKYSETYTYTHRVLDHVFMWHSAHCNVPFDKGEVFIPTLILTLLVTSPVWGAALLCDGVRGLVQRVRR